MGNQVTLKGLLLILGITIISACSPNPENLSQNDKVINTHGTITNLERLELFVERTGKKTSDSVQIKSFTIEGDPIYYLLIWNGSSIDLEIDDSKDKYRGDGPDLTIVNCERIIVDEEQEFPTYMLKDCKSGADFGDIELLYVSGIAD